MVTDESLKLLARRQPELLASTLRQHLGKTNIKTFDSDQVQQILSQGITSCGRSNLWQEALEIFQLLIDQLEKPDVISYSALISSFRGQWQRAMQLFTEMLQARNEADAGCWLFFATRDDDCFLYAPSVIIIVMIIPLDSDCVPFISVYHEISLYTCSTTVEIYIDICIYHLCIFLSLISRYSIYIYIK